MATRRRARTTARTAPVSAERPAPRVGAFSLGMRGTLLARLARLAPGLSDRYRMALARAATPEAAEALMRALCEDIARRTNAADPAPGPAGLRTWLHHNVLWVEVEQHMLDNADFYLPRMRRG